MTDLFTFLNRSAESVISDSAPYWAQTPSFNRNAKGIDENGNIFECSEEDIYNELKESDLNRLCRFG